MRGRFWIGSTSGNIGGGCKQDARESKISQIHPRSSVFVRVPFILMQTYSHGLLTAVFTPKHLPRDQQTALVVGSMAPDVGLGLLTVGYLLDRRLLRPHLPDKTRCSPTYNDLYFNNPWWIAIHNSLHAPLPLLTLLLLGFLGRRQAWGRRLFSFAVGCLAHAAVDIVTHVDDGPVLLFPFDWHGRFAGPVSYWDARYNGRLFRLLEHLLDVMLAIYLLLDRQRKRTKT